MRGALAVDDAWTNGRTAPADATGALKRIRAQAIDCQESVLVRTWLGCKILYEDEMVTFMGSPPLAIRRSGVNAGSSQVT